MQHQDNTGDNYREHVRDFEGRRSLHLPSIIAAAEHHARPEGFGDVEGKLMPAFATNTGSVSPIERNTMASDLYRPSPSHPPTQVGQFGQMTLQNPKRAYRQRRKDPSCDACRERKVKCDATDTTSCTECSSRNVRCQFTKDTNRRMSSIKQVQDLERQLQEVKAQLERTRSTEHVSDVLRHFNALPEGDELEVSRSSRRVLKARSQHDLSTGRAHLSDNGRPILKPVISSPLADRLDRRASPISSLPPRELTQQCLDAYVECVHRRTPILHWTMFCQELWGLYDGGSNTPTRGTIGLCFAVLALGALFSHDLRVKEHSGELMQIATSYLDLWMDNIGIHHGLATFLTALYLMEINARSTAYVWLGSAIRIAQDRGLHVQEDHPSPAEGEMQRRIWYSLYVWDRLLATELRRPMLIHDNDCDIEYPTTLEGDENTTDVLHPQNTTLLLASVHVARLLGPLTEIGRSPCITDEIMRKFEAYFANCMQLFPPQLQLGNPQPLDPLNMAPVIYFQNARLLLYRRNMSPACSPEQRSTAIESCAKTARETAGVISRCFLASGPVEHVEARLKASANFLTCTHLWRCMLFLAFTLNWKAFHVLLRFSALVGDAKPINTSCGSHLNFFLRKLIDRYRKVDHQTLADDEDLLVLLTADLQAGTNSWAWGSTESGQPLNRRQKYSRTAQSSPDSAYGHSNSASAFAWDNFWSEEEGQQWGGWSQIHEAASWLEEARTSQKNASVQIADLERRSSDLQQSRSRPDSDLSPTTTRSRITIASITDS